MDLLDEDTERLLINEVDVREARIEEPDFEGRNVEQRVLVVENAYKLPDGRVADCCGFDLGS